MDQPDFSTRIESPVYGKWTAEDRARYTQILLDKYRGDRREWVALFTVLQLDSYRIREEAPNFELLEKVGAIVHELVDLMAIAKRIDEILAERMVEP
jgi:hypothetical protein